ncbi:protein phosphatase CheZ [Chitinimonas sp. DQS-5]|uniref:Protein phosphatase CheZ n=1 Tax=Parachitinimonas caeni TaxID=3031301 RepID=A0ABT7DXB1_9NEIS|nr:protein phosphatase CheZ [Parachitinimonas caeni]
MSDNTMNSGDSDELQDLFDSIVRANAGTPSAPPPPAPAAPPPAAEPVAAAPAMQTSVTSSPVPGGSMDEPARSMFESIGQMTRKIHDALRELGYDKSLEQAAAAIPDARDRLAYIATLTEQAAEKTLNAVDAAKPMQDKIEAEAEELIKEWDKLFAKQMDIEQFKALVSRTREHLKASSSYAKTTNDYLLEIMMAQDFQDLTGQVIKKIVDMAKQMETHLLAFLLEFSPNAPKPAENTSSLVNGPVYNAEGRTDVVTNQEQVDDLLASLGF